MRKVRGVFVLSGALALLLAPLASAQCWKCPPSGLPNNCLAVDVGFGGWQDCAIFTATIEATGGTLKWCIEMNDCQIQGPPDYGTHCQNQPLDPACDPWWGWGGGGGEGGGEPENEEADCWEWDCVASLDPGFAARDTWIAQFGPPVYVSEAIWGAL